MATAAKKIRNLRSGAATNQRVAVKKKAPLGQARSELRMLEVKVMQLRMAGWNFEDIGQELGCSTSTAYNAFNRALRLQSSPLVDEIRKEQDLRLLGLMRAWWPIAVGRTDVNGRVKKRPDIKAAELVLKIESQRASLWGSNAPTKISPTNVDGDGPAEVTIAFGDDPVQARRGMMHLVEVISGEPFPDGLDSFDSDANDFKALPSPGTIEAGSDQD